MNKKQFESFMYLVTQFTKCGVYGNPVDHIIPRGCGGNIKVLFMGCNNRILTKYTIYRDGTWTFPLNI